MGLGHQFSYTPPQRELSSDSSSDSDDVEASEDEHTEAEVESHSEAATPIHRRPIHVRHVDEQVEFTVEEMSENDMGYDSDTEAVQPDHIEDAESEIGRRRTPEVDHGLVDQLNGLHCEESPGRRAFEEAQRSRREKKMKRWSKGGSHKRSHAESAGMDSDDDIQPLDVHQVGSSARRLRRRTDGPDDKPRTSLLFDDPPKELEELKSLTDESDDTDDVSAPLPTDHPKDPDPGQVEMETTVQSADEEEVPLPYWLYPMEIDSDPSRPPSSNAREPRR